MESIQSVERYGRKDVESVISDDGSKVLQRDTQLSGMMHNVETMNKYDGKLYYSSEIKSDDGRMSYEETIVDDKEAGKTVRIFDQKVGSNGKPYFSPVYDSSEVRIPNTGKKTVFTNSIEGSDDLVRKDIDDESKDIRLKYICDDKHNRTYDESTPIFDEHGKQIGMLRTVEVYNEEDGRYTRKRSEVYDGNPQLSCETSVIYGRGGIESVSILENGKLIRGLSKKRNGQIAITALDKETDTYSYDTYLPSDGEILVDGFDGVDSSEIPDLYINSHDLDGGYNPFTRWFTF